MSAEKIFGCVARQDTSVFAPHLFLAKVAGILVRFLPPRIVRGVVHRLRNAITLVGDDVYFTEAVETALATGSRDADSYYICLAKTLNAPLATSVRIQALNAKKLSPKHSIPQIKEIWKTYLIS